MTPWAAVRAVLDLVEFGAWPLASTVLSWGMERTAKPGPSSAPRGFVLV